MFIYYKIDFSPIFHSLYSCKKISGNNVMLVYLFRLLLISYSSLVYIYIYIYTLLSDLGDLSDLIGSLSRTIQQYYIENDLLKLDKILGLTFFKAIKDFEGFKTVFFYLI